MLVGDEWSGEPEDPEAHGKQPTPAVGRVWVSWADRRPAEVVFEETEAVLDHEASGVPVPEIEQIVRQGAPDPGEPQRLGLLGVSWEPLDLDADDGERGIRSPLDVQVLPDSDLHQPVDEVIRCRGLVWTPIRRGVCQLEDRPVHRRPPTPGARPWPTVEVPVRAKTDQ
jgi:hypothetical protein